MEPFSQLLINLCISDLYFLAYTTVSKNIDGHLSPTFIINHPIFYFFNKRPQTEEDITTFLINHPLVSHIS